MLLNQQHQADIDGITPMWKDVVGYKGTYQVSSLGEVRSFYVFGSSHGRTSDDFIILKGEISVRGYKRVRLCKNGFSKKVSIHQLVAKAFVLNVDDKPHINHKDGIKLNNNADNLEWCTPSENMQHCDKNGLRKCNSLKGEKCHFAKLNEYKVRRIRLIKEITPKLSNLKIAKMFKMGESAIASILNNRTWQHIS